MTVLSSTQRYWRTIAKFRRGEKPRHWRYRDGRQKRYMLALHYSEMGWSYRRIGQAMGLTRQSARSAVKYARLRFGLAHRQVVPS